MVDLFLVHERHVFELRVRGELTTPDATAAVVAALAHHVQHALLQRKPAVIRCHRDYHLVNLSDPLNPRPRI